MLMVVTRFRVLPSFDFRGAGQIFTFGSTLLVGHGFFIIQSQSDIFIAGRHFDTHDLGLYAEALFLTQLFATKFIPPLNEVAFPAYARLQHDKGKLAYSFLKAVRLIMLVAFPLYFGMAVTAAPFVATLMGEKWIGATPIVAILALAMPIATLQFLFQPAINALGLPGVTMRNAIAGAIIMPLVYLMAIRFGPTGLAWGWLVSFPLLLAFTVYQSRTHIGFGLGQLIAAIAPGLAAASVMAAIVWSFDRYLLETLVSATGLHLGPLPHLLLLAGLGALVYAALLWFGSRRTAMEVVNLVVRRKVTAASAA